MKAKEKPFSFISVQQFIEIPFFQRGYVWQESNWEELLENLLDTNNSHFLGSIIMKSLPPQAGEISRYSLIDGQQRLTTLSILTKACYERLIKIQGLDDETMQSIEANRKSHLFCKTRTMPVQYDIKIRHSNVDRPFYERVIKNDDQNKLVDMESIVMDNETNDKGSSNRILQCYKYFTLELGKLSDEKVGTIWEILVENIMNILVCITLDADENEQAIFDAVNSSGVRLTCADTIKNSLFQKAIENSRTDEERDEVISFYEENWEKVFSKDSGAIAFWNKERHLGRITRDNIEILLHSVAVIKGFYNPETDRMSDLSQKYKDYIRNLTKEQLYSMIKEIKRYAQLFQQYFISIDSVTQLRYEDYKNRMFHILAECESSTFYPYILKILAESIHENGEEDSSLKDRLKELEVYVLRHIICGATTKNFNKECQLLVSNTKTVSELIEDKKDVISDEVVRNSLKYMPKNRNAAIVLFWIELERRFQNNTDLKSMNYNFQLEHIMPQKWKANWGIDNLPVFNQDNVIVTDLDVAEEIRTHAVYEIGNMTLLNSKLNNSINNSEFKEKVQGRYYDSGKVRMRGYKHLADFYLTREVIEICDKNQVWDERVIRNRTSELINDFLRIWSIV